MKKLLALLVVCTAMTCVFASCGNDEKDESSVSNDTSVSDESSEETTEPVTEEETEEVTEETIEEETEEEPEEDTEEDTEKTTREYLEDADATAFLGKWECESMVIDGEELTDFMGVPIYVMFQFDIKEDGTATTAETELADAVEYTWGMISETEMEIVSDDGTALTFTFEGDKLAGRDDESDDVIYLIKVDEFTPFDLESIMNDFDITGETAEDENDGVWVTDDEQDD
ncbi:MAG: hypothetical protein K2G14_00385 [Ruminococcus sp.]|nr:hypothetical protein [Ruminococcus sp.]